MHQVIKLSVRMVDRIGVNLLSSGHEGLSNVLEYLLLVLGHIFSFLGLWSRSEPPPKREPSADPETQEPRRPNVSECSVGLHFSLVSSRT